MSVPRTAIPNALRHQREPTTLQEELQPIWKNYFSECQAVVYVIDLAAKRTVPDSLRVLGRWTAANKCG